MKKIQIIVATHKPYRMPDDPLYLPMQAGAARNPPLPYLQDNIGDNISEKNPNYCELTCLYAAWKNIDAEYLGLCHYRRYFAKKRPLFQRKKDLFDSILTLEEADAALTLAPVLVPKKRKYYIESVHNQYVHAHHGKDLDTLREVLAELSPEMLPAFDTEMHRKSVHIFNMFVMRRDLFHDYCEWLFSILSEVERRTDLSGYSAYEQRVFGFLAERLLDTWLDAKSISFVELPCVNLEPQNWPIKIFMFIKRKFLSK